MGLFVGFTLIANLSNQRRYEMVISEILQYLKAHEHELSIEYFFQLLIAIGYFQIVL